MSIVNADTKSLEWISYLFISQDKVGIEEWLAFCDNPKLNDIHTKNQKDLNLVSRLIAKIFLFRCIYRGPAFAYSMDPDFANVSKSPKFWQGIIDKFFDKYRGLNACHTKLIQEVTRTGQTVSPFGRVHQHEKKKGEWYIPDITNHINQGCGADVMVVARVLAFKRWKDLGLEGHFISTVHDSIVMDVPDDNVKAAAKMLFGVFKDLPKAISQAYKVNWNLPLLCEIGYGPNQKDLTEIKESDL